MASRYMVIENVLDQSKVFQRGKTQIPKDVRKALHLEDGDKIIWYSENNRIWLEKAMRR